MTKRTILLQALASTPADVERLARGVDDAIFAGLAKADTVSPGEIVNHLLAVEHAYLYHINRIIGENEPIVPAIHTRAEHFRPRVPLPAAAEQFRQAREEMLATLEELPAGDWQRKAIHETEGRIPLRFLIQCLVEHDIEHTNQLVEIRQAWRKDHPPAVALTAPLDAGREA